MITVMNSQGDYKEYTNKKMEEMSINLESLIIKYEIYDFSSDKDTQKIFFTKDKKIYGEINYNGDIKKGKENAIYIIDGSSLKNLIRDIENEGHILDKAYKEHLLKKADKVHLVELTNIKF